MDNTTLSSILRACHAACIFLLAAAFDGNLFASSAAASAAAGSFSGQKYCYVHVGKASGSKLSCELGFRYAPTCPTTEPIRDDLKIVAHRGGFIHMEANSCEPDANVYLFSVRNPVERFISWYNYEHIRNFNVQIHPHLCGCSRRLHKFGQWDGCFESLEEFALNCLPPALTSHPSALLRVNNDAKMQTCRELAWEVAQGRVGCLVHNEFNYAFYANKVNKLSSAQNGTARILAIRSSHIDEDWDTLELLYGGNSDSDSTRFNATMNKSKGDTTLSPEGLHNLCRALCHEIQVYKSIIYQAENLDEAQRTESLEEVKALCAEESYEIQECHGTASYHNKKNVG